jgi:hypothetical protein
LEVRGDRGKTMDEGREMMDGKGLRLEAEGRREEAIGERRWTRDEGRRTMENEDIRNNVPLKRD